MAALSSILTSGCVTARLNQFRGFAQAGVAYARASRAVTEEAGTAAISATSATLLKARPDLPEEERRQAVRQSDDDVKQRLLILRQLNAHAQLLEEYFQTLADMADSNAPEELGAAAQGLYNSIAAIGAPLKSGAIGNEKVSDFIPGAVEIVVANIKVKALERELRARAPAIERELSIQQAALSALAKDIEDNLTITLNVEETQGVIAPYAAGGALPADWVARRDKVLRGNAAARSTSKAIHAAESLRESFARLVRGNLSASDISSLMSDTNSVLDLVGKIRDTSDGRGPSASAQ